MEKKKRPGNLPNGSPGPLLPAARFLFARQKEIGKRKTARGNLPSNRSSRFDWKRRSDRTPASMRGSFVNRGCETREVSDDEAPSSRPRGAVCPPLDPPASVTWSRYSVQNSRPSSPVQAPGETYASSGRGGMTERLRVITALSETGITTPVRSIPTTAAGGIPPVEGRGAYRCCTRNLRKSPRLTGNPPGEARLLAVSAV